MARFRDGERRRKKRRGWRLDDVQWFVALIVLAVGSWGYARVWMKGVSLSVGKGRTGTGRSGGGSVKEMAWGSRRNIVRDGVGRIVESGEGEREPEADEEQKEGLPLGVSMSDGKGKEDDEAVEEIEEVVSEEEEEEGEGNSTIVEKKRNKHEFMGSTGGQPDGMVRGHNVTKVSHTVYKILKLFGFGSMSDSPAGNHTEWMGDVVRQMAFEQPGFQYVGVDGTAEAVKRAKEAMGEGVDGDFEVHNVEQSICNGTDVLVHWTEMDGGDWDARSSSYLKHVARVMLTAKKMDHGYMIVGQLPRLQGPMPTYRHGKWVFLEKEHRKEEPFLFNEHVRGVVPMSSTAQAYVMYLTFYSLRSMSASDLELYI